VAELARHFFQGDDEARALKYSLMTGDRAASLFAHDEAEQHFRKAAELAGAALPARRSEALEKCALALRALARYEEALLRLEEAARFQVHLGRLMPKDCWQRISSRCSEIWGSHGRESPGFNISSCRHLARERSQMLAVLHVTLAGLFCSTGQFHEQLAAAVLSAELARIQSDDHTLLRAEVRRGQALRSLGRYQEAQQVLEMIIPDIEAAGDLELLVPPWTAFRSCASLAETSAMRLWISNEASKPPVRWMIHPSSLSSRANWARMRTTWVNGTAPRSI
jgi:tetratricopeptide (TPR) repeat protein